MHYYDLFFIELHNQLQPHPILSSGRLTINY